MAGEVVASLKSVEGSGEYLSPSTSGEVVSDLTAGGKSGDENREENLESGEVPDFGTGRRRHEPKLRGNKANSHKSHALSTIDVFSNYTLKLYYQTILSNFTR